MRLANRQLERRLRRAARREISQSEKLRAQWQERKRALRRMPTQQGTDSALLGVCMATVAIGFFISVSVKAAAEAGSNPWLGALDAVRLAAGIQNLLIVGIICLIAGNRDRSYFQTDHLGAFACLPVDDDQLVRSKMRVWLLSAALLTTLAIAPPLAWAARANAANQAVTVVLVAIGWIVTLACGLLAAAYSPRNDYPWRHRLFHAGLGLVMLGSGLAFVAAHLPSWLALLIGWLMYATPSGWVDAALVHGVLHGNAAAWWFLAPALGIFLRAALLAAHWVRTKYAFREIAHEPESGWQAAVLESGFCVHKAQEDDPFESLSREQIRAIDAEREEQTEAESVQAVLAGSYLCNVKYTGGPYELIERTARRLMDLRHQTIAEGWSWRVSHSTYTWRRAWKSIAFLLILVWLASLWEPTRSVAFLASLGLIYVFIGTAFDYPHGPQFVGVLPITLADVCRAMFRFELVRAMFWLPLFVVYGMIGGWLIGAPLGHGLLVGVYLAVAEAVFQPYFVCNSVAQGATTKWRYGSLWFGRLLAWIPLVVIVLHLYRLFLLLGDVRGAAMLSAGIIYLTAAVVYAQYCNWAYRRGKFDLACAGSVRPVP